MFRLSILCLIVSAVAAFLTFGVSQGRQVDATYFVFIVSMSLFSISGLISVFITPRVDVRLPLVPPYGRKTVPD
jgi:uncharacterized membrane protein YtjA (UPF0391 family)